MTMKMSKKKNCDVCIVGGGPAGLAALSAIHEPYTLDSMTSTQVNNANVTMGRRNGVGPSNHSVIVVDPSERWMDKWAENFQTLEIDYLRSPALAHPDHFDVNSLLAYAVSHGRENELIESGCGKIKALHGLGQTQVGLWKLPSSSLFLDFCVDLAKRLKHDYVQGFAENLRQEDSSGGKYTLTLSDGTEIEASSIILALGQTGTPQLPRGLMGVSSERMFHWKSMWSKLTPDHESVLVVGGGLTAVQVAQSALRMGKRVVLASRRPLVERHFDIDINWFDRRNSNFQVSGFYHLKEEERLRALKEVRGGGSVPPIYMDDLRKWVARGKLTLVTADPEYIGESGGRLVVALGGGPEREFDCIVLATGIKPDCSANPFVKNIMNNFSVPTVGGFPDVSVDLEWRGNLFCVGALASLNVGPDGANLMGARRAASIVANTLECKQWLREGDQCSALANKFHLFMEDSSDSDSDTDGD